MIDNGVLTDTSFVSSDEGVVKAVEAVDVPHHACRSVHECKMVTEQFLTNPTDLMDVARVFQYFT